jgi:type IV pilus assembly protein PilC
MTMPLSYCSAAPYGRRLQDDSFRVARVVKSASLLLAWSIAAVLGMGIFGIVLALGSLPLASILGPASFLLFIVCLTHMVRTIRRRRAAAVLSYLEQAIRLNLPLPRMLRAAGQSETGKIATRLADVSQLLECGAPLDIALETQVPEMPARQLRLIGAAQHTGRLPEMLRMLVNQQRTSHTGNSSAPFFGIIYAILMLLFISGVTSMFIIFVMPKLMQVFLDFKVPLPALTVWMRSAATSAAVVLPLVAVAAVVYPAMKLWEIYLPANPTRRRRWLDWLVWWTPLAHSISQNRGLADACYVIAQSLKVGFPLDRAIFETTDLHFNRTLQRQLRQFLTSIQSGSDPAHAARGAGLPSMMVGMLATAQASGSLAEVFAFLARYYQTRFSRTVLLLQGALAPLTALVFGAVVCCVALNLFLPMVRLIEMMGLQWHKF